MSRSVRVVLLGIFAACGSSGPPSSEEAARVGRCKPLSCREVDCGPDLGPPGDHDSDAMLGFDIHPGIGNLHLAEDDAAARPAIGSALGLERHYNSAADATNHGFGPGWSHTYGWRLTLPDPATARIATASGRAIVFTGGPAWTAPAGEYGTLAGSAERGFTYTTRRGTQLVFDRAGRLTAIQDPTSPSPVAIAYGDGDAITAVTSGAGYGNDGLGSTLRFRYTGDRITEITDPAGHTWQYGYDEAGRLALVTRPGGGQTRYTSSDITVGGVAFATGDNTSITRVSRLIASDVWIDRGLFSYKAELGQVTHAATSVISGVLQDEVSLAYALCLDAPSTTTAKLAGGDKAIESARIAGRQRITAIKASAGIGAPGESTEAAWQWNADLTLASVSSGGITTAYADYDGKGSPRTVIEGAGSPAARTTRYRYHPVLATVMSASRTSVDGASQHVVIADYDADRDTSYNKRPTAFVHQLIEQGATDTALTGTAAAPVTLVTRVDLDDLNRPTRLTYPNGKAIDYGYFPASAADPDAQYRLATRTVRTTGDASLVDQIASYDALGRIARRIDPRGATTSTERDALGHVIALTVSSSAGDSTDKFTYNLAGQLATETTPGGRRVVHDYDAAARPWRRRAEAPDGSVAWSEVAALDDRGKVLALRRFAGNGELTAPTCLEGEPAAFCAAFSYDAFRRRATTTTLSSLDKPCAGDDCRVTFRYDAGGNLACTTEAGLHTTCFERDGRARLAAVVLPNGTRATFRHDINDQLIERRDPRDRASTFVWDDFGRELSRTTPDAGRFVTGYDAGGLRIATLDARGIRIDTAYDLAGRPTGFRVASDPTGNSDVAYVYDETGALPGTDAAYAFSAGRVTTIVARAADGTRLASHRSYDARGHVVDQVEERGAEVTRQRTTLGSDGEPLATTYPDGKVVAFQYPKRGGASPTALPESASVVFAGEAHTVFDAATYAIDGRLASLKDAAGGVRSATRNKRGELVRLVAGPPADPWVDDRYDYDAAGRGRLAAVHHFAGRYNAYDETYDTDELGRITATASNVSGALDTAAWTYDQVGNRLSETRNGAVTTYRYADPATNRLTSLSGAASDAWTYDASGFLASHAANGKLVSYGHDAYSRLRQLRDETSVVGSGGVPSSITFSYLATACSPADIVFSINGTIAARAAADTTCSCAPGVRTVVVTDPAIVGLLTGGANRFTVSFPQYLAWAVATVNGNDFAIYDAGGGDDGLARNPDLCAAGYAFAPPAQTLAQPSLGAVVLTYLATSCSGWQPISFSINGAQVATRSVAGACTCSPGIATVRTTDPAVLGALHAGVNTLGVSFSGYLAWAVVGVEGQGEVAIYDPAGHAAARDPNLCGGAYGGNVTAAANTASYTPRAGVSFTYDGHGRLWERRMSDGRYTRTYYDASGRISEVIEFRGELAFGAPQYHVIDHVRAGGTLVAQLVRLCRKPSKAAPVSCSDTDLRVVAEGRFGPAAIESALRGTPTWMAALDPLGTWLGLGSLRGVDGKTGTADDLAMTFGNLTGSDILHQDPFDGLITGLGRGGSFKQSISDRLGGPQLDSGWDGSSYMSNQITDGLALIGGFHTGAHGNGPPLRKNDPSLYGMHDGKLDEDDDPPADPPAGDDTPLSDPPLVTAEGNLAGDKPDLTPKDSGGSTNPAFDFSHGGSGSTGTGGGGGSSSIDVNKVLPGWAKEVKEHVTIPMSVQDTTNPMPGSPDYTPPGSKMCADNMECGDDVAVIPAGPPVFKKDWISHPVNPSTINSAGPLTLPDSKKPSVVDPMPFDEGGYTNVPTTMPDNPNCVVSWRTCGPK